MKKMYWSQGFHKTFKDDPADAEIPSHKLLMRAGLIKKVAPGIYTYGPMALRALRKIENIIREELDFAGCQELLMPMVQPRSLWDETDRYGIPELLKFKNRNDHEFCLGATHEEVITDYVRNDLTSYKDLPVCLYQIQTKYRDEIRPRFGLMRGREFIMKDAYSFDESEDLAKLSYQKLKKVYIRIFDKLGLEYRVVQADSGAIGGSLSEEFQVLAQIGEDLLLVSDSSDFAANKEICARAYVATDFSSVASSKLQSLSQKKTFETPGLSTIQDLSVFTGIASPCLVKSLFLKGDDQKPFVVLLRGSDELNPIKLKKVLNLKNEAQMLNDQEVLKLTGATPGSCGPQGLNVPIYADHYLKEFEHYLVGANKTGYHTAGLKAGVDFKITDFADVAFAQAGDPSPDGSGVLREVRGIEVGHIFYLGTKYSKSMKALFQDKNGKTQPFEMGCYGIGVGRTMQSAIEQSHDENGIIWPKSITPFDIHISVLDPKNEDLMNYTSKLIQELNGQGLSVFVDDRNERPGVKFKDADLIGFPMRLTLGQKSFEQGQIEILTRYNNEKINSNLDSALNLVLEKYNQCR